MKKRFIILAALVMSLVSIAQKSKDITLMSYNIHVGIGMDNKSDLTRIAKVINHAKVDIVGLQEVDSMNTRSMQNQVEVLGKLTDMHYIYAPAIPMMGGGKYGIAVLSKEKPLGSKNIPLPGSEEKRTVVFVEFEDYVFINTHFSLTEADRIKSVVIILEEIKKYPNKLAFLVGDLNTDKESEVIPKLKERLTLLSNSFLATYPSDGAEECLDHIFTSGSQSKVVKNFDYVYQEPLASDHLPVVVGVRIMVD